MPIDLYDSDVSLHQIVQAIVTVLAVINPVVFGSILLTPTPLLLPEQRRRACNVYAGFRSTDLTGLSVWAGGTRITEHHECLQIAGRFNSHKEEIDAKEKAIADAQPYAKSYHRHICFRRGPIGTVFRGAAAGELLSRLGGSPTHIARNGRVIASGMNRVREAYMCRSPLLRC
jgi:hypothetical protein